MSQLERIFEIDRILKTAGRFRLAEFAAKFEVSTRQARRDVEYLRDRLNAPIVWNAADKTYRYETPYNQTRWVRKRVLKGMRENGKEWY